MIVTLLTAGLSGIILLVLSFRVVSARTKTKVMIGDGGESHLLGRIRAHANFAEYMPVLLILIGVIEGVHGTSTPLWIAAIVLLVARVAHAIGMEMPAPNPFRVVGAAGTWTVLLWLSGWALWLAYSASR
jgi:uncharacterized membrane protein YecN with MAPEG domain